MTIEEQIRKAHPKKHEHILKILRLYVQGHSSEKIAKLVGRTHLGIRQTLLEVYDELGIDDRNHLVRRLLYETYIETRAATPTECAIIFAFQTLCGECPGWLDILCANMVPEKNADSRAAARLQVCESKSALAALHRHKLLRRLSAANEPIPV